MVYHLLEASQVLSQSFDALQSGSFPDSFEEVLLLIVQSPSERMGSR